MKHWVKLAISLVVYLWDISCRALGLRRAPRCVVLYYHAVPSHCRKMFARQMDLLLKLVLPLSSVSSGNLDAGQRYAVITFDDGFVSVKENAAPELRRRQIPWTLFVPSGCLGQTPPWLRKAHPAAQHDRVMNREELRALANDPLVTIGSHSVAHAHLVEIGPSRAAVELAQSKADLERVLERPVEQFSYPFGARTPALDQQALALGYRRLFSTAPALSKHPGEFLIGRFNVDPDISLFEFRLRLLGAYRWQSLLKRHRIS